jgi:hypothetical protein
MTGKKCSGMGFSSSTCTDIDNSPTSFDSLMDHPDMEE